MSNGAVQPSKRRAPHVFLGVSIGVDDREELYRLGRVFGTPGNTSATMRTIIRETAERHPRRRRQAVSVAAEAAPTES